MSQKAARFLATSTATLRTLLARNAWETLLRKQLKWTTKGFCFYGPRNPSGTSSIAGSRFERCVNHGNHDNCAFRESEKWFIFDKRHNVAAEGAQEEKYCDIPSACRKVNSGSHIRNWLLLWRHPRFFNSMWKKYTVKLVTLFEGCLNHSYTIYNHFNYSAPKITN